MRALKELTIKNIENKTGMSFGDIAKSNPSEIDAFISKKTKRKIKIAAPKYKTLIGRGSPLLSRLSYMLDIDRRIQKI